MFKNLKRKIKYIQKRRKHTFSDSYRMKLVCSLFAFNSVSISALIAVDFPLLLVPTSILIPPKSIIGKFSNLRKFLNPNDFMYYFLLICSSCVLTNLLCNSPTAFSMLPLFSSQVSFIS